MLDLHLAVVAVRRKPDGGLESPRPVIYGTAFPIAPGLFVTAGHVADDARADGMIGLAHIGPEGGVRVSSVPDYEVFSGIDLAVMSCPDLSGLPAMPLDFNHQLTLLDPAYAIGYPWSLDPEWVTVVPRGFRGHVVTRRETYQLPAQPPGYELSFLTPKGMSGAPLVRKPVLLRLHRAADNGRRCGLRRRDRYLCAARRCSERHGHRPSCESLRPRSDAAPSAH